MSIFRLLSLSLLVAVPAASFSAQSSPEKNLVAVQSTDSERLNAPTKSDSLYPSLKPELTAPKPLDRIRIDQYRPQLNQFVPPRTLLIDPDRQPQDNTLCYAMRSYKVARDDPRSDSTHAAGYSTCQPAARFHVHTTEEQVLPTRP